MRRYRRYPSGSVWVGFAICAIVASRYFWDRDNNLIPHAAEGSTFSRSLVSGECEVVRVERADLLVVSQQVRPNGQDRLQVLEAPLQLLGVESRGLAEEGKRFTREFLSSGTPTLELDRRRVDNSGHFLAYVHVDDRLLNEELIRAGLARADLYPGDNQSIHRNLVRAEQEARRARRGIWEQPAGSQP